MKKLILVFILFLLPHSISASNYSCNDLKDFIIKEKFTTPPKQELINGFGFSFYGNYNENGEFIFNREMSSGKGITINKIFNETLNNNLNVNDAIIKINNIRLEDLNDIEFSKRINDALESDNLEISVRNYITEEVNNLNIFQQLYKQPLQVWIDFNLQDITFINVKENTYSAKYNSIVEWRDNRYKKFLSNVEDNSCEFSKINENDELYNSFWQPEIVEENKINNIDTFDNFQYSDLLFYLLDDDVYIILNRYNNATFNVMFDLKEFPFDIQNFYFDFYTPATTYEIILEDWYDQENTLASREYFLSNYGHPEWQYTDISSFIESYEYIDGTYYDNFSYYVGAKRNISYYVTKVIIPIFLILIICWSVFWISGLQLESRLTVTSVSFLALIAYNYVVEEDLPKLGYNTILDQIILCSYIFAGLATILTVYSYTNCKNNGYEFCTMDYLARYMGPVAYIIVNAVLIVNGIQSMTAAEFLGRFL